MAQIIDNYIQDFDKILGTIKQTRQKAYSQINYALIELYWSIGMAISNKVEHSDWGKVVVAELAIYITNNDPTIKGFSDKNLWRMKQFYETYKNNEKLSPLVRELPWTHNMIIFSRCKSAEEREFYLKLSAKERYSKRDLDRQIDSCIYERTMIGNQNISSLLQQVHPMINDTFKDNYVFSNSRLI